MLDLAVMYSVLARCSRKLDGLFHSRAVPVIQGWWMVSFRVPRLLDRGTSIGSLILPGNAVHNSSPVTAGNVSNSEQRASTSIGRIVPGRVKESFNVRVQISGDYVLAKNRFHHCESVGSMGLSRALWPQ